MSARQISLRPVTRVAGRSVERHEDAIAVERPLEIRVAGQSLSVTLRTPGEDEELTLGFLAGESLIARRADVTGLSARAAECDDQPDTIDVALAPGIQIDWTRLERRFASTSACGLCGRAHLESLRAGLEPIATGTVFAPEALVRLPEQVRAAQATFLATGGLHAAAWLDSSLAVHVLREDIGRHNAVDKVAGWLLEAGRYRSGEGLLWVSGRAGAEIALKAARARIPLLVAVGAPSSLAVDIAETARMTLIGFLREGRMNVYCGADRLAI